MAADDSGDGSELMCEVCQNPKSIKPNEIVICDRCDRGFHQLCHSPRIPGSVLIPDVSWVCKHCFYSMSSKERNEFNICSNDKSTSNGIYENCELSLDKIDKTEKNCIKLPYDLDKLHWDEFHLTNSEDVYCYCGRSIDFFRSLLQCQGCKQWFHMMCIKSIENDLLIGDQYFKFVCSICTNGQENCKRITMRWHVVVGLALSNMTYGSDHQFFSVKNDLIPYLIENHDKFAVSCELSKISAEELLKKVEPTLNENRDKFICKDGLWSLNVQFPYEDPLTYSPFHQNLKSTFFMQKQSRAVNSMKAVIKSESADTIKKLVPDGACRKNASMQPLPPPVVKVKQFKKQNMNDTTTKRAHVDHANLNDSSKIKKSKHSANSLLKTSSNQETTRNGSKSSTTNDEYKNYIYRERNLLNLDQVIPFPENFNGKNNPFYTSPASDSSASTMTDSNHRSHSTNSDTDSHHHSNHSNHSNSNHSNNSNNSNHTNHQTKKSSSPYTSSEHKVQYRVVNNEPNKLVLSRVNSINENSSFNLSSNHNNHTDLRDNKKSESSDVKIVNGINAQNCYMIKFTDKE